MSELLLKRARETQSLLSPHLPQTPLVHSEYFSKEFGREIFLKIETNQPTRSFKIRPALSSLLWNFEKAKQQGVVAASSGNFAQAVAYACSRYGISSKIVMMKKTSPAKVKLTQSAGGQVIFCENTLDSRVETTEKIEREENRVRFHPYDSEETILGDMTLGLELLAQYTPKTLTGVIVPASGGGLLSAVGLVIKSANPAFRLFGAQGAGNGAWKKSFQARKRIQVDSVNTIADALIAPIPGEQAFSLGLGFIDGFEDADEGAILDWQKKLHHQKIQAEPAACVPFVVLAGLIQRHPEVKSWILLVTGANG